MRQKITANPKQNEAPGVLIESFRLKNQGMFELVRISQHSEKKKPQLRFYLDQLDLLHK
jgi:hypothetical protein